MTARKSVDSDPSRALGDGSRNVESDNPKDYVKTYVVAIVASCAMLALTKMFAKVWSEAAFLEYARLSRYLGVAAVLASFSLGFSIIGLAKKHQLRTAVFPAAFWGVVGCAGVIWLCTFAYTGALNPACLWVVSQASFHVYISSVRYEDWSRANRETLFFKGFLVLCVGALTAFCLSAPADYFWAYGCSALVVLVLRASYGGFAVNPRFVRGSILFGLYGHAASRAADNVLRLAFHVVVVWLVELKFGERDAGLLAIAFILVKALESSLQPVVMHLHAARTRKQGPANVKGVFWVFLAGLLGVGGLQAVLLVFGDALIGWWLGDKYVEVLPLARQIMWAIPCILVVQYLRGQLESQVSHSPFLVINLIGFCMLTACIALFGCSTERAIDFYLLIFALRSIASTSRALRFRERG